MCGILSSGASSAEAKYLKSLLFINCGGKIDLKETNLFKKRPDVLFYLIDNYRPYHHSNIIEKRICVIDDGCVSFDECPTIQD